MAPGFYNVCGGYTDPVIGQKRMWGLWWRTVREFRLTPGEAGLYFVDDLEAWWRPDKVFWSDGASVPPPATAIPGFQHDRYLGAYYHDSGYKHGGLWRSVDCGKTWMFIRMPRREIDDLFEETMRHDPFRPGHPAATITIWAFVRVFGGWSFGEGDPRKRARNLAMREV